MNLTSKDFEVPSMVTSVSGIFPAKSKIIGSDQPLSGTSYYLEVTVTSKLV